LDDPSIHIRQDNPQGAKNDDSEYSNEQPVIRRGTHGQVGNKYDKKRC
jgi:hypothetical protein